MLGQKLSAPSRLLLTDDSFATVAVGFPDLDKSTNDLYCWFRQEPRRRHQGLVGKSVILDKSSHQVKETKIHVLDSRAWELKLKAISYYLYKYNFK